MLFVEAEGANFPAARISSFLPLLEQYLSAACAELSVDSSRGQPKSAFGAKDNTVAAVESEPANAQGTSWGGIGVARETTRDTRVGEGELELSDAMGALHERDRYVYTLLTLLFRLCSHAHLISSAHFEPLLVRLFRTQRNDTRLVLESCTRSHIRVCIMYEY